jgi:4-amino-4-deoxy-L-arabinose transferase-like glycosyltransferase
VDTATTTVGHEVIGREVAGSVLGRVAARLRSVAFPVAVYAVWRFAEFLVLSAFGGQTATRQTTGIMPEGHPGVFLWDGAWYQRILHHGYQPVPSGGGQSDTAFFPLLPWMTKLAEWVVGSELVAALLVTSAASLAAVILVYEVVRVWKGDRVARWAVVLLVAFPTSFYLWQYYSESLLLAASAGALLAVYRDRMALAGLCCALAAASRPPGVLIVPVVVIAYVTHRRRIRADVAWLACGFVGLGSVMLAQLAGAGDPFAFEKSQSGWGLHSSLPWSTIERAVRFWITPGHPPLQGWGWSTASWFGSPRDYIILYLFFGLGIASLLGNWPWEARAMIGANLVAPLLAGSLLGSGRVVLAAWPALAVLSGSLDSGRLRYVRIALAVVFAAGSVVLLHDWSRGFLV